MLAMSAYKLIQQDERRHNLQNKGERNVGPFVESSLLKSHAWGSPHNEAKGKKKRNITNHSSNERSSSYLPHLSSR